MKADGLCQGIELILSDVDGVLTDGGVTFDNQGIELKQFHIRDGLGIQLWERAGFTFGIVTSRSSHIVKVRAAELKIDLVRQGVQHKMSAVAEIVRQRGLSLAQVCFIGDDLPDLGCVKAVGLGVAVADAASEVRAAADLVTTHRGGQGAVRETVEFILKAKKRWEDLVRKFE